MMKEETAIYAQNEGNYNHYYSNNWLFLFHYFNKTFYIQQKQLLQNH